MAFEPKKYLIKVQGGRLYLPVAARLIWFRSEHPDWGIVTEALQADNERQFAIFRASIYNAEGRLMATGTKREDIAGFPDYLEKAETGAVGRALALCGYGTQFAPELDEAPSGRFADSPQSTPRYPESSPSSRTRFDDNLGTNGKDAVPTSECTRCGKSLTRSQQELSIRHYGAALCPTCQKDKGRAVAAT